MTVWVCLNWSLVHFPFSSSASEARRTEVFCFRMNLYRSFGNLMETWVTDDNPSHDPLWLGNNSKDSPTSSSYMEPNLRSESVDSGVETASCDTVLSTSGSVSTDHTEMDLFMPQKGLSSQSPVLYSPVPSSSSSSSSPQFCPIREEKGSTGLHLTEEASLQKTDSVHLRDKPKTLTVEEVLSRRPRASLLPKRHTSDLGIGQRTENSGWRVNPSLPIRQRSDVCRRPVSLGLDTHRSEGLAVGDNRELSPGLDYLEQVCQMLEGIAREQMHSRGMQPELEALWEDQDAQTLNARPVDAADEEALVPHEILHNRKDGVGKPQQWKNGHFRQRSASDTALSTIHLRKMNTHDKGQLMSTTDLLERAEDEEEKQVNHNLTQD
ncbi:uncharacterized protein LOC115383433 isoform X2 [Salarias fasciatus]|uniref:uncharacterized protein LOC115383433 isoform X2 n=1 Tax=Salarias fasciatus TaxID=181472 RepID=UPI0011767508|nr:uncharacterized protein LOC115383433 isoform X2 [Salarias fasciatus]